MSQIDMSKIVPSAEQREEAARLYQASIAATEAVSLASQPIMDKYHARFEELRRARDAEEEAATAAARAAEIAADKAYEGHPLTLLNNYDDDEIVRCAVSGVPLLEDDEILYDRETDERVLRCLVLPPRAKDEAEAAE